MSAALPRGVLIAWLLALGLFVAITVYYIVMHHVVPLSRDQWHMYDALFTQGLWHTSIGTVSGHRHVLAFLLYTIDLQLFSGNNHFLMVVDWLLNSALIALLCAQIVRHVGDRTQRLLLCGTVVLLHSWLINIALLGWGFNGINNYLAIVNIALSAVCLHAAVRRGARRYWWPALGCAALATFSFGNGVLAWLIGALLLACWRASSRLLLCWLVGGVLSFVLYFALPGGGDSQAMLRAPGLALLLFPVQVLGGPLYHLLRAWSWLPETLLTPLAGGVGALLLAAVCWRGWQSWRAGRSMDALDALCWALITTGLGSTAMLALARVDGVLDFRVDRFQIFALLVWTGCGLLQYRQLHGRGLRSAQVLLLLLPLLALPSQLDWGARLAEYRSRVDKALLAYQVYLPVAADAEKALHWNWAGKLPHLFPVLEQLRATQANVFSDGLAQWLGQTPALPVDLRACAAQHTPDAPVRGRDLLDINDLLDISDLPASAPYRSDAAPDSIVGWRWQLAVTEQHWDGGLLLDAQGAVRGLIKPVRHSRLPRASGLLHDDHNGYGITRQTTAPTAVLLWQGQLLCRIP